MTEVVNIKDGIPSGAIYIGRAGKGQDGYFGNPYRLTHEDFRDQILKRFEKYARTRMQEDEEYARRVKELRGKTLVCFCAPLPCHGDILAELADEEETIEHI